MNRSCVSAMSLLLIGCTPEPDGRDTGTQGLDWGFERPSQTAQYTADELAEHVESWADTYGFPFPQHAFNRYLELMEEGDESCPAGGSLDDTSRFPNLGRLEGCSSSTGWDYIGIGIVFDDDLRDEDGIGAVRVGFNLADFVITSPDGEEFSGGGSSKMQIQYQEDQTSWNAEFGGSWEDQTTDATPWMKASGSVDYMMTYHNEQLATNGYVGIGEYAFLFDRLILNKEECPNTPHDGTLWVRQEDGSWNQLTFANDCSGCATGTWNEEVELGEVCLDISLPIDEAWNTLQAIP